MGLTDISSISSAWLDANWRILERDEGKVFSGFFLKAFFFGWCFCLCLCYVHVCIWVKFNGRYRIKSFGALYNLLW